MIYSNGSLTSFAKFIYGAQNTWLKKKVINTTHHKTTLHDKRTSHSKPSAT